jgi:hypothetical protein
LQIRARGKAGGEPHWPVRTQTINQLTAVLIGADPALRDTLTGLS